MIVKLLDLTDFLKDVFGKKKQGDDVIVIINQSEEWRRIDIPTDAVKNTDTLSGEVISDGCISLDLAPLSYRLFTPERNLKNV